ncbi:MAG: hypothetical protein ACTHZ5_10020 [Micrococcaceae bacterium]
MTARHAVEKRVYELVTTLSLEGVDLHERNHIIAALNQAVFDATGHYPTVTAYFVKPHPEGKNVSVGLRIEKPRESGVENIAQRVIDDALAALSEAERSSWTPEFEGSTLVIA